MAVETARPSNWRDIRRRSARDAIVDAAWDLVAVEGLAGLSMRELALRAGITTPTVYAYFDSKHAIYDAMFGQAANQFVDRMDDPYDADDPLEVVRAEVWRFVEFCTENLPRYQLLFQRTIPGFEPSAESYEPAVRALEDLRQRLWAVGIVESRHLDLWTALVAGLVNQQASNDPGGDRWIKLVDESVSMLLEHCGAVPTTRKPVRAKPRTKGAPA
jgi:AcrR family transcriptional regulator